MWISIYFFISAPNVHRGFGFVEYADPEDCQAAIDNMHLSELYGKVIKVQIAKTINVTTTSNKAGKYLIYIYIYIKNGRSLLILLDSVD